MRDEACVSRRRAVVEVDGFDVRIVDRGKHGRGLRERAALSLDPRDETVVRRIEKLSGR